MEETEEWLPATVHRPQVTAIDGNMLHNEATLLEGQVSRLVTHLREIANNASYQRHKGILKARRREIGKMREVLDLIDQELVHGLGDEGRKSNA